MSSDKKKKTYIEPYAKEKNLLQLSLFFLGKKRPKRALVEWEDDDATYKLECVCKYGVPGSFDQDVYTACMRLWVQQGMQANSVRINYSEIAKVLGVDPKHWVGKIKDSLKKLAQARYELTQCFLRIGDNGPERIDTHFSLFESVTLYSYQKGKGKALGKRPKESTLAFPEEIRNNLEAKYYQLLDMAWYRALPQGLPRRLYEFLEKRRYHNVDGIFKISEEILCRWLPLTDKNITTRRETLRRAVNALIEKQYLRSFQLDTGNKQCVFEYGKEEFPYSLPESPKVPVQQEMFDIEPVADFIEIYPEPESPPEAKTGDALYLEAIQWVESIPYFRKKNIDKIKSLPHEKIISSYPHVKYMWENGKITRPGGIYSAFVENWRDEDFFSSQEKKRKEEEEKNSQEAYQEIHKRQILSLVQEHGEKNLLLDGMEILEVDEEGIYILGHSGARVFMRFPEINLGNFKTRVSVEESAQKSKDRESKRLEEREKKERETSAKQAKHRESVIEYIENYGIDKVFYNGKKVTGYDEDGIRILDGEKEKRHKFGNIIPGVNLKKK